MHLVNHFASHQGHRPVFVGFVHIYDKATSNPTHQPRVPHQPKAPPRSPRGPSICCNSWVVASAFASLSRWRNSGFSPPMDGKVGGKGWFKGGDGSDSSSVLQWKWVWNFGGWKFWLRKGLVFTRNPTSSQEVMNFPTSQDGKSLQYCHRFAFNDTLPKDCLTSKRHGTPLVILTDRRANKCGTVSIWLRMISSQVRYQKGLAFHAVIIICPKKCFQKAGKMGPKPFPEASKEKLTDLNTGWKSCK